jgi:hypothetical protein
MELIAERNNVSVSELEDNLYADLDDEQYLVDYRAPSSLELMKYYNYANMIALLAYSLRLEIEYRGTDDYLGSLITRLGESKIAGSQATKAVLELKPTRRLSQRAVKIDEIMSRVISKSSWSLRAVIKYPARYKTPCTFEIESRGNGKLLAVNTFDEEIVIEIGLPRSKQTKYGDIIVVDDMARRQGTTTSQILRDIKSEGTEYRDLGGVLVTPEKYDEISTHLKNLSTIGEVQAYFKELKVRDFMQVFESFGYQVEWRTPRKNSKIYKL